MYPPTVIANYFINKAIENNDTISPMKLIKLVYFAHCWHIAIYGSDLINEPVEAWQYGPVISSLYHEFKRFGNEPIEAYAPVDIRIVTKLKHDDKTTKFLDKIWEVYGNFTAVQLSNLSHEKGSPWDQAWNEQRGFLCRHKIIKDDIIKDFYLKKAMESSHVQQ